jgi:uncharacterized heparinase superfamily protein
LWIYNLHYFRYLWTVTPVQAGALIADWIETNTRPQSPAWQPYPISLRVREWIEWLLAHPDVDAAFKGTVVESIARQTEALARQLEFHLLGNHLLENAITLCWAGVSFAGPRAQQWSADGLGILREQIRRQILGDGTHEERSPMYQALLAEGLLRLGEVAQRCAGPTASTIRDVATRAGRALLHTLERMVHPDGQYALLNDSALGLAPSLQALRQRFDAAAPAARRADAWSLDAAGYVGCDGGSGQYLVFDGGPIGPDHQPGHGHADTLSFELSHRGRRLITDTGVGTYLIGATRQHDRSTAAHNTIEIDGRDQSELWGAFRCARRPFAHTADAHRGTKGIELFGSYRGPGRGLRSVTHTRRIVVEPSILSFTDEVVASGCHTATIRLHVAPGLRLRRRSTAWAVEETAGRSVASVTGEGMTWSETASPYHSEFGREESRPCLMATLPFRHRLGLKWWVILR